jgi:four helix bundle protein
VKFRVARTNFENLEVYRLAEQMADEVWRIVLGWDYLAKRTLGQQLVRACDAIGANIAEGSGRGSYQDNRRFIRIARGSLNETQHWLRRAFHRKLLTDAEIASLKPIVDELGPTSQRVSQVHRLDPPKSPRQARTQQLTTDN